LRIEIPSVEASTAAWYLTDQRLFNASAIDQQAEYIEAKKKEQAPKGQWHARACMFPEWINHGVKGIGQEDKAHANQRKVPQKAALS
jgi:hypothetical protein